MNSYWTIRSRKLTWNLRLAVGRLFQWFFLFSKGVFAVPCSFWGVYSPSWTPIRSANKKKLSTTPPHLLTCTVAKILEDYNPTTTHARFEQINTDSDNCHVSGFFRMTKSGSIMMNKMWKVILKETKHKCLLKKIHWLCFPNSQQHWNVSWVNLGIPPSVTKWTRLLSAVAHRQPPWFEAKNICPTNNKELKQKR